MNRFYQISIQHEYFCQQGVSNSQQEKQNGLVTLRELARKKYDNGIISDFEIIHAIKPYSNENEERQLNRPMKMKYPSSNLEEPPMMEEKSVFINDGKKLHGAENNNQQINGHENDVSNQLPDEETVILEREDVLSEEVDPETSDIKAVTHTTITVVSY